LDLRKRFLGGRTDGHNGGDVTEAGAALEPWDDCGLDCDFSARRIHFHSIVSSFEEGKRMGSPDTELLGGLNTLDDSLPPLRVAPEFKLFGRFRLMEG
jgi:hypothetical protein